MYSLASISWVAMQQMLNQRQPVERVRESWVRASLRMCYQRIISQKIARKERRRGTYQWAISWSSWSRKGRDQGYMRTQQTQSRRSVASQQQDQQHNTLGLFYLAPKERTNLCRYRQQKMRKAVVEIMNIQKCSQNENQQVMGCKAEAIRTKRYKRPILMGLGLNVRPFSTVLATGFSLEHQQSQNMNSKVQIDTMAKLRRCWAEMRITIDKKVPLLMRPGYIRVVNESILGLSIFSDFAFSWQQQTKPESSRHFRIEVTMINTGIGGRVPMESWSLTLPSVVMRGVRYLWWAMRTVPWLEGGTCGQGEEELAETGDQGSVGPGHPQYSHVRLSNQRVYFTETKKGGKSFRSKMMQTDEITLS